MNGPIVTKSRTLHSVLTGIDNTLFVQYSGLLLLFNIIGSHGECRLEFSCTPKYLKELGEFIQLVMKDYEEQEPDVYQGAGDE